MYYKKKFEFYNAPLDRVNVAATRDVLNTVLGYSLMFSIGKNAGTSDATMSAINAEMRDANFEETQTTLFVPYKSGSDAAWLKVNYLRISFFAGTSASASLYRFFFVDSVEICDTEDDAGRRYYKLTLSPDLWHTYIIGGANAPTATLYGGTLTRAAAITQGLNVDRAGLYSVACELPFNPLEQSPEIVAYNPQPVFSTFRAVLQLTGKDLGRSIMIFDGVERTARGAIEAAQKMATAKGLVHLPQGLNFASENLDVNLREGEFSVQGAYVVPAPLCPPLDASLGNWYPWIGGEDAPLYSFWEISGDGRRDRFRASMRTSGGASGVGNSPYPSTLRRTVGTPFNRFDLTEFYARGSNEEPPEYDTTLTSFFGVNSFNIFISAGDGGRAKDITNDFQVFSLVDPENDSIRQNKTNAVLSGIGSVGTIIGGVAAIASGAGAAVGVGAIAAGVGGLARTASGFATAKTAPDVLTGGGYGDVAAYLGGVYYEESFTRVAQWDDAVLIEGVGRRVRLLGLWDLTLNTKESEIMRSNPLAVAGASVRDVPAVIGDGIAAILAQGVRLWYNAYSLRDMEF